MSYAEIGKDPEAGYLVKIDDNVRPSGTYILGKPGMGKSNLIELLILSQFATDRGDHDKADGLFFLDPHGDAIDRLTKHLFIGIRMDASNYGISDEEKQAFNTKLFASTNNNYVSIINAEDEEFSICINPLQCDDLTSLKERNDTYTRAYNIFYKIFEAEWGVWLQLIIQNTLYVFLENPDYTLADVPLFYTNENFRRHLVNNVKYKVLRGFLWS